MAEQTIDKLQIEVEATTKSVSSVFSSITSQLKTLNSVASSIDVDKIVKAKNALDSLNKSTGSSKSNTPKIDTTNITKAEKDIQKSVSSIKSKLDGLTAYSNAAKLGDSSSFTSFQRRVISIQSDIDVLKGKMESLGDTRVETEAFTKVKEDISDAEAKLTELQTKKDEVMSGSTTMSSSEFSQLESDIKTAENEMDVLQQKQDDLVNSGGAYTDPFASYKDSLTEVEGQLGTVKTETEEAFNKNNVTLDLSKVTSSLQTVLSKLWQISSTSISSAISGLKSKFSGLGSSVSGTTDKISSAFKTILKYGLGIRSLYVLFRRLRTAIKDSFTELQTSGAMYQTTKANIDALKTSLSTLKYQFGAAFEPIFNTIAPALTTLINYLVSIMNTISALIAKLTGNSTYSKAVVSTAAIASNTGSAASSAKELNKQLQGFDELNNLTTSDSSSGGSGSSSSGSTNVTYVEENVENALGSFSNSIINAIQNGDWEGLGSTISSKITGALNKINWDTVFSTLSNWGTNLANFLNGLITPELFDALGTTIGNAIKAKLTFLNSFGETFNWINFGNSIATGIKSFFDTHPLTNLSETVSTWAVGITSALATAVTDLINNGGINSIKNDIIGAIEAFKFEDITWNVGTIISGLLNSLYVIVSDTKTWSTLGTKIGEGINGFIKSMGTKNATTGKTGWEALMGNVSSIVNGIINALTKTIKTISWSDVGKAIAEMIKSIEWGKLIKNLGSLALAIIEALCDAIKGLWDNSSVLGKIGIALVGLFTLAKLTGLTGSLATALKTALTSQGALSFDATTLGINPITLTIGLTLLFNSDSIGNQIGSFFATLSGNDELKSYYQEYCTWGKILPELKRALDEGDFWDGFTEMLNDFFEWLSGETSDTQWSNAQDDMSSGKYSVEQIIDSYESLKQYADKHPEEDWSEQLDYYNNYLSKYGYYTKDGIAYYTDGTISSSGRVKYHTRDVSKYYENQNDALNENTHWAYSNPNKDNNQGDVNSNGDIDLDGAGTYINGSYSGNTNSNNNNNTISGGGGGNYINSDNSGNTTTNNITNQYGTASGSASSQAVDYGIKSSIEQSRKNIQQATDGEIGKYTKEVTKSMEGSAKQLQEAGKSMVKALGDGISSEVKKLTQGSGSTGSSGFSSGFGYGINNVTSSSQTYDFIFKVNGQEASNSLFGRYNKEFEDINKNLGGSNKNNTKKKIIYNVDARQTGVDSSSTTLTDAFDNLLNSMSNIPSNTSLDVNLGGDMNTAGDITSWASRFSTLTSVWEDGSSTLSAEIGGDMTSINDTDDWKSKFKALKDEWTGSKATFDSEYKNSTIKDSGYTALKSLRDAWNKTTTANFDAKYTNNTIKSKGYTDYKTLRGAWKNADATFNVKYTNNTMQSQGYKDFDKMWKNWNGWTATAKFTVAFSTDASGLVGLANKIISSIETSLNAAFAGSSAARGLNSIGRISLKKITNLATATGGIFDGSTLRLIGEAGTEAVVPLENNLGWLNKMSDMMIEGMENSTKLKYTASPSTLGFNQSNVYGAMASNDELVSEQNRLLEEQNDLLRQILDKPSGISSRDVFNAVQGESNSYYNRTGNSPFLF